MSITDNRRWPKWTGPCSKKPSASGPRWARVAFIRRRISPSCGPGAEMNPLRPHMALFSGNLSGVGTASRRCSVKPGVYLRRRPVHLLRHSAVASVPLAPTRGGNSAIRPRSRNLHDFRVLLDLAVDVRGVAFRRKRCGRGPQLLEAFAHIRRIENLVRFHIEAGDDFP